MRTVQPALLLLSASLFTACQASSPSAAEADPHAAPVQNTSVDGGRTAYFAAGCFWVEEAMFESLKGVSKVYSGYCGGTAPDPSYEEVCTGRTGHAETVEVHYDPKVISYATLLKVFFGSQDPTTRDRQGPDEGTQYRSAVFYQNENEKAEAEATIEKLDAAGTFGGKIVTEVVPFQRFWKAEAYHQGYERLHPDQPYVATVSKRRYDAFAARFHDLLK